MLTSRWLHANSTKRGFSLAFFCLWELVAFGVAEEKDTWPTLACDRSGSDVSDIISFSSGQCFLSSQNWRIASYQDHSFVNGLEI